MFGAVCLYQHVCVCVCVHIMWLCMHTNSEHVLATVLMLAMFNCGAQIYAHHVFMFVLY